jgi:hypothetical protein
VSEAVETVPTPAADTGAGLHRRVDAALAARVRLRGRPLREAIAALAAAADAWVGDATLRAVLPGASRLSPPMIDTVLPIAAAALDAEAMTALVARQWGAGAADRPAPPGPALVVQVLASNVPALALPAIALGCLAGAAVVVKSGRADPHSAPAFERALAAVDPDLAATVVTTYWAGGDRAIEESLFVRADVVVATGGDAALAALGARVPGRLVAHGPRTSVVVLSREGLADLHALVDAVALDVALHDQRGCLSPHAVYVEAGGAVDVRALAERLAQAMRVLATRLPLGPATVEERAAAGVARAGAAWEPGTTVLESGGGAVICDERIRLYRPTNGRRTVRVHPVDTLATLPELLAPGAVECVGVAGADPAALASSLRARGVSRLCPPGRMQRPPLAWPRGQLPALGSLLGRRAVPVLEIDT